jgi:multidrug efflux pump subunit AcrA (membrane-fusion protein)
METEIKKDEAILHQVSAKLEMKTIRSPVDGVVVKVDLAAGEYVGEKPIMTIVQIDPLNVEVVVPVSEYGTIKKGMYADVRPEDPVGGVHPGKVTIVDRVVNAASGSFGVRVELPNPNLLIPSGLKCNVKFKGRDVPKERGALPPRL